MPQYSSNFLKAMKTGAGLCLSEFIPSSLIEGEGSKHGGGFFCLAKSTRDAGADYYS